METPALEEAVRLDCDVLVIGGGTAGTMAALTAADDEDITVEANSIFECGCLH